MTRDGDNGLFVPVGPKNVSFYLPLCFLAGLLLPSFYKLRMVMREREHERYATFVIFFERDASEYCITLRRAQGKWR